LNFISLGKAARLLGGEVSNGQILCPGPGHSPRDRSLSVKLDANAPDGFLTHSFAGDDRIACRDMVREKFGMPAFKPNGKAKGAAPSEADIERAVMAAANAQKQPTSFNIVAAYDYNDTGGDLLYQVCRLEPKSFRHRQPDGGGDWIWKKGERLVLYRWPELKKFPDATVFITEGEKDADRVASLGHCATTVAGSDWEGVDVSTLAGRDIVVLEDNDKTGREKALKAALALNGKANSIRVVTFHHLDSGGDASDYLDGDTGGHFVEYCFNAPLWVHEPSNDAAPDKLYLPPANLPLTITQWRVRVDLR
jgi:hypothetical protein